MIFNCLYRKFLKTRLDAEEYRFWLVAKATRVFQDISVTRREKVEPATKYIENQLITLLKIADFARHHSSKSIKKEIMKHLK